MALFEVLVSSGLSATFELRWIPRGMLILMKTIRRELAHVGLFGPDGVRVTKADLSDCATTFDGKCPVTLGHALADWMPKFGNVKTVTLAENGESLSGEVEVHDLLADAVDEGLYEDVSVGIQTRKADGKRYLHHLAYLGAIPPKIRDLKVFDDLGIVLMSDSDTGVITEYGPHTQTTKEDDVELKEENEQLKRQLADAKTISMASMKDTLVRAMDGRIPKGKQDLVLRLADTLPWDSPLELADAEGKKESVAALEVLRRIIEAIPRPVQPGREHLSDTTSETSIDWTKLKGKF